MIIRFPIPQSPSRVSDGFDHVGEWN